MSGGLLSDGGRRGKLRITLDARVPFERQFYALSGAVVSKLSSVRGRLEMDGSDSSNRDERMVVKKVVNRI